MSLFVFYKEGRKLVKINKTREIITNLHVLDTKMDQIELTGQINRSQDQVLVEENTQ